MCQWRSLFREWFDNDSLDLRVSCSVENRDCSRRGNVEESMTHQNRSCFSVNLLACKEDIEVAAVDALQLVCIFGTHRYNDIGEEVAVDTEPEL